MQYAIIIYEHEDEFSARQDEGSKEYWGAWQAYTSALSDAGVLRGGEALREPEKATTVTRKDGGSVQDGPFATSKELLGGFYVIDVETHEEAIEWAMRCPCTEKGYAEVRPILSMDS